MTIPPPSDPAAVAVELEKLRGTMAAGFATVNGSLALVAQRTDQTDRILTDHEQRLDALERARWPLPSLAALVGVVSLALALWQLSQK
ncbi:hypothetical protein SFUL_5503 [Streptomyces microflavus DSM 40593]|uniref:Uncharacterized protein n=1 Tax=Streptomyces microflavus DSM 40593 TaxID=1303692 RepID=N0CW86_STRMI|nr:hypothetical protein [Streptomyces microflavus]AGK80391.1 hypothetical protein SFUL_5503 [Streptomyces microflavus DSM 40593]